MATAVLAVSVACGGARGLSGEKLPVLQNEWWDWAVSSPVDRNPVTDTTGAHCAEAQPGDKWFLAATFGDMAGTIARSCAIPAGRPIFVPAVSVLALPAPTATAPVSRECAAMEGQMSGTITLDGVEVVLEKVEAAQVTVVGVMGNPVSRDLSPISGAGCGLWARIEPLSAGTHTLLIRGDAPGFTAAVDYTLTVSG